MSTTIEGFVRFPPEFAERYRAAGLWRDKSLWDLFVESFEKFADRPAIVGPSGAIDYADLKWRSEDLAAALAATGLRSLDRVVVQLPNVIEFVLVHLALQRLGVIPIMALPAHREREISHFIRVAGARAYICKDATLAAIVEAQNNSLELVLSIEQLAALKGRHDLPTTASFDPEEPAVLLLSGGTTGLPKLIPRTHNDYWYNSMAAGDINDIRPTDALLAVLPLAHNFPLACPGLQGFLQRGARVVLSSTTDCESNLALVQKEHITHLELVPALLIRWMSDSSITRYDLSSIRVVNTGGHRLQPELKRRCEELLPSATVQEVLGMAEGLLCFVRLDDPAEVRYETAGRPISPLDEIRVVDELEQNVPEGQVGELLTRGPYTIRGYFRAPDHNATAFTLDGFYRTGDLVRLHPTGNVIVAGRKKDLINRGGEKISAEEVENLIISHPAVLNVACIAVPDPVLGERMCACMILRPGANVTLEDLTQFLLGKGMAKFKLPERLEVMSEFPTTRVGKISKQDLAHIVSSRDSCSCLRGERLNLPTSTP